MFVRFVDGVQQPYVPRPTGVHPVTGTSSINSVAPGSGESKTSLPHQSSRNPYQRETSSNAARTPAILVKQIMSAPVVTLTENNSIREAQLLLTERKIRHLLIVDAKGGLTGIISERDILRILARGQQPNVLDQPVSVIMSRTVLTTLEETDIRTAARILVEERIGCLPVVNEEASLSGIVTRSDILRTILTAIPLELWI